MLKKQNSTKESKAVISKRKTEHIKIVLNEETTAPNQNHCSDLVSGSPFAKYRLPFRALPEINLSEVDTTTKLLGYKLKFPFIVSSMTGGPDLGKTVNINLAEACQHAGCGLALGSMRIILRDPSAIKTFNVKKLCPDIPLFANMGLVQLNYGYGADQINKIIDSINADGIFLHINPMQEAVQPEGDTNFKGLLEKLENVLSKINKPVFVKEVGTGIDHKTAKALSDIGIKYIDVSGLGGTSWTLVESYRRKDKMGFPLGEIGIPTDEAILTCSKIKDLNIIAGGGIRNGVDIAKSIMLGAKLATAAKPLLKPALTSSNECFQLLEMWKKQLQVSMFAVGAKNLDELSGKKLTILPSRI